MALSRQFGFFRFFVITALVVAFSSTLNPSFSYAGEYKPIETNAVPKEVQAGVSAEISRILGVSRVSLKDVHFGSNSRSWYVCAFFSNGGELLPFAAEMGKSSKKWRVVSDTNRNQMLDRKRGSTGYFAILSTCASNDIALGRWNNLVQSSPYKPIGGGNTRLTKEQVALLKRDLNKQLGLGDAELLSSAARIFSASPKKPKITYVCGYTRTKYGVNPFDAVFVNKRGSPYFIILKKRPREPVDYFTTIESCHKDGFSMPSRP